MRPIADHGAYMPTPAEIARLKVELRAKHLEAKRQGSGAGSIQSPGNPRTASWGDIIAAFRK